MTNIDEKHEKTASTDRQLWLQTQAVHDDDDLSMTTALSVTKDDTTLCQTPYQTASFAYHRHHSAEQYRYHSMSAVPNTALLLIEISLRNSIITNFQ